jgi:hypothetical protein
VQDVSRFEAWNIQEFAEEEFEQESVLFVNDEGNAYLYFYRRCPDAGGRDDEYVGAWTEMASQAAPPSGDWTLIGNSYFITRDKGRW